MSKGMSRFIDGYEGSRHRLISEVLFITSLMQGMETFTVTELHKAYCDEVGTISDRTIRRYIVSLEKNGLVEEAATTPSRVYRWAGWPLPIGTNR